MQVLLVLAVALLQLEEALAQQPQLLIVLALEAALVQLALGAAQLRLCLVEPLGQSLAFITTLVYLCLALLELLLAAIQSLADLPELLLEGLPLIAKLLLLKLDGLSELLHLVFVPKGFGTSYNLQFLELVRKSQRFCGFLSQLFSELGRFFHV